MPRQDLGPLALEVTPGLSFGGVERFGGYIGGLRILEINPTKPEHVSNPTELVDTIVHELIHAVHDLAPDCVAAGSPVSPLKGAATVTPPTRAEATAAGTHEKLMTDLGPGASNPCEEFLDINAAAQQIILQMLTENVSAARVGRPTVTFVNEILRRDPEALQEYEACRGPACRRAGAEARRRAVAKCSVEIIGKFIPRDLETALLPARVHFSSDSATVGSSDREQLDMLAVFIKSRSTIKVTLVGHTDEVGSESYNRDLGLRRAKAIRRALIDRGVDPHQIERPLTRGEDEPLSTGTADRWKDRRVEVSVTGGGISP